MSLILGVIEGVGVSVVTKTAVTTSLLTMVSVHGFSDVVSVLPFHSSTNRSNLYPSFGVTLNVTLEPEEIVICVLVDVVVVPIGDVIVAIPAPDGLTFRVITTGFVIGKDVGLVTVTAALPKTVPLVAVTVVVPAADAVNVVEAFPPIPVTVNNGVTLPTVELLIVQDMLIPGIGVLF